MDIPALHRHAMATSEFQTWPCRPYVMSGTSLVRFLADVTGHFVRYETLLDGSSDRAKEFMHDFIQLEPSRTVALSPTEASGRRFVDKISDFALSRMGATFQQLYYRLTNGDRKSWSPYSNWLINRRVEALALRRFVVLALDVNSLPEAQATLVKDSPRESRTTLLIVEPLEGHVYQSTRAIRRQLEVFAAPGRNDLLYVTAQLERHGRSEPPDAWAWHSRDFGLELREPRRYLVWSAPVEDDSVRDVYKWGNFALSAQHANQLEEFRREAWAKEFAS